MTKKTSLQYLATFPSTFFISFRQASQPKPLPSRYGSNIEEIRHDDNHTSTDDDEDDDDDDDAFGGVYCGPPSSTAPENMNSTCKENGRYMYSCTTRVNCFEIWISVGKCKPIKTTVAKKDSLFFMTPLSNSYLLKTYST